ncbi:hypothetical protein EOM09_02605, partial [bacterium]|nr:hypothetical protein [bacterium]
MNKLLIFILFLMILPITFANFELEEQNLRNEKIESISNYIPISQINIKELINEKSKIKLYNADFNTVDLKDIKINNDLIYFNSKKYNINPVTFQREITKSITEYEIIKEVGKKDDLKESKKSYETYTEYKDYIAEISFECSNGNYDIYHYNELTEDKNLVKTKGNKIASLSCNNNQISLKIDSFSTYAIFESLSEEIVLDTLTNQTLNYNNVSLKGYYRLPVNETLNISFNINDENIVETELTTCETLNHGVVSGNVTIEDGAMVFDGV